MAKKTNRVVEAILEMADDQLRTGIIDKAEHEKITIRHGAKMELRSAEPGQKPDR